MHLRNKWVSFFLFCTLFALTIRAQQDSAPAPPSTQTKPQPQQPEAIGKEGGEFVIRKQVEEVVVHATVLDRDQRMVTTLDRNAFKVFEDGKEQRITSFRHEDIPVAMGIVIDNSGSMREKRDRVNRAALNLVRASNPQDQVFVVNFNDEYFLDQDFTADIGKLKEALEKIEARGGTAMYDALVASADQCKNSPLQKKVLFAVTDGDDTASRQSLEQTIKRLQEENGPTVYAIAILGEEKRGRIKRVLNTITERTGGLAFFPKSADEVDAISRQIAHDVRNQYTLGYKPTNPKTSGGYRSIRVEAEAKGMGRLTVRTRSGYYAGQERASASTRD